MDEGLADEGLMDEDGYELLVAEDGVWDAFRRFFRRETTIRITMTIAINNTSDAHAMMMRNVFPLPS